MFGSLKLRLANHVYPGITDLLLIVSQKDRMVPMVGGETAIEFGLQEVAVVFYWCVL